MYCGSNSPAFLCCKLEEGSLIHRGKSSKASVGKEINGKCIFMQKQQTAVLGRRDEKVEDGGGDCV